MKAQVGDWLLINSHHDDRHARRGKILNIGPDGGPPYTVRWADDDHEAIMFPGPDADVVTSERLEEIDRIQAQRIASAESAIGSQRPKRSGRTGRTVRR
jgi:hypothetical protein